MVLDGDGLVDDVQLGEAGDKISADPFHQISHRSALRGTFERVLQNATDWVGHHNANVRILFLEIRSRPAQRPSRSYATNQNVDATHGLLPQLWAGRLVMGRPICLVVKLISVPAA